MIEHPSRPPIRQVFSTFVSSALMIDGIPRARPSFMSRRNFYLMPRADSFKESTWALLMDTTNIM